MYSPKFIAGSNAVLRAYMCAWTDLPLDNDHLGRDIPVTGHNFGLLFNDGSQLWATILS
jgi:hypothetical protein